MILTTIITSVSAGIVALITAYMLHTREIAKINLEKEKYRDEIKRISLENKQNEVKLDFFNRAMDLSRINPIIDGVNDMFNHTIADRFLILIAINGKTDFNIVSVIFEQHKNTEYQTNAIGTYRNIEIDSEYRKMLKQAESNGPVELEVSKMDNSVLKEFYDYEGVKHSKIRFLDRQKIDNDNDFLVYSSLATHEDRSFSKRAKTLIKTTYESNIIPNIKRVLN